MKIFKVMKKLFKILLWTLLILILIPIILLLAIPLWLGPVVKPVLNSQVPKYTGTAFNIGKFHINPYTGYFEAGDMFLDNPAGFSEEKAVKLGTAIFDLDMGTIRSDVIIIENIELTGLFVSYVKNSEGKYNFEAMGANAQAEEAQEVAQETEQVAQGEEPERRYSLKDLQELLDKLEGREAPQPGEEPSKPVKFIVKRLYISDISGRYNFMPFRVPSIELHDLGADSGGYIASEMGQAIVNEVLASILASSKELVGAVVGIGEAGIAAVTNFDHKAVADKVTSLGEEGIAAVTNFDCKAATEDLTAAGTSVMDKTVDLATGAGDIGSAALGTAIDSLDTVTSGALDIGSGIKDDIGNGLKNTGNAFKGLLK